MIDDVIVIDFGESRTFSNANGEEYNFILDGRGLTFWKKNVMYSTRSELIESIDEIVLMTGEERVYNVNNISCTIKYEN